MHAAMASPRKWRSMLIGSRAPSNSPGRSWRQPSAGSICCKRDRSRRPNLRSGEGVRWPMHCWLNCAQPRAALIQLQARWRQGEETPVSVLFTTSKWSSAICGVRRHGATGCCDVVSPTQAGRGLCNAAPLDAGQDRASRPRRLVTRNRPSDRRPDRFSCRSVRANARVRAMPHGPGCLCAPATGGELEMRRTNPINVKDYNVVLFVANARDVRAEAGLAQPRRRPLRAATLGLRY